MSKTPETPEVTVVDVTGPSTKRQVTAAVTSTAVTVILGVATNLVIAKIAGRVHEQVLGKPQTLTQNEQ